MLSWGGGRGRGPDQAVEYRDDKLVGGMVPHGRLCDLELVRLYGRDPISARPCGQDVACLLAKTGFPHTTVSQVAYFLIPWGTGFDPHTPRALHKSF
jgi:hypothetical protein